MDKWKIMVVEDDAPVRHLITVSLSAEDYTVIASGTAAEAVQLAATQNPDMILLDLGLPDGDGDEVIEKIRLWTETPIIVISARDEDTDKIEALDAGADDYLTKPFSVAELLARLRSTQRRLTHIAAGNTEAVFKNGDLVIDYAAGCAYLAEQPLKLTPIEYRLLCLLAQNVGKVLTHKFITQKVWGVGWENNIASLRVFMATLRKKLETYPGSPTYIQTHIGVGYRMLKID
ncbi:MAG: response regulator transcription factor [Oscillospiraceae bacterium]|nr:response regulator transcription factor [Oscillospiraceae bacterium]